MLEARCGFNDAPGGASGAQMLVSYGPTILADIGFDSNYKPYPGAIPVPGISGIHALVDTGAFASCIDSLLASQLNLPIVDRQRISGVHGIGEVNIHLAQVWVPALQFTIYGRFAGVHLIAGGQPHRAIVGRTFLNHFTMIYEGTTGTVTISKA